MMSRRSTDAMSEVVEGKGFFACKATGWIVWLLSISLTLALNPAAAADGESFAKPYSLTEICSFAVEHAQEVALSREDLFIAEQTREKALAVLVPRFSAFAETDRFSEEKSVSTSFAGTAFDTLIQPQSTSSWGLRLEQSFTLNGKELIAFGMAEDNIRKSRHDLRTTKESFVYDLTSAYFQVLMAKTAVAIADANRERLRLLLRSAEKRFAIEEATRPTLLRARAELARADTEQTAAANALAVRESVLARLSGIPPGFAALDPNVPFQDLVEQGMDALTARALQARPEIHSIEMAQQIAEDQVRLSRSDYWPTVSIGGLYLNHRQEPTADTVNEESLSVGLSLNFTIYDGGLRDAQISEQLARQRQVGHMQRLLERQIRMEVEQAFRELVTQADSLPSIEDQLFYARENYEAVVKLFRHGMADSIDIVDANTLLVTSERQLWEARYRSQLAALKLHFVSGTLLERIQSLETADRESKARIE